MRTSLLALFLATGTLLAGCSEPKSWYCVGKVGPCYEKKADCEGAEWELDRLACSEHKAAWCSLKPQDDVKVPQVCYLEQGVCENMTSTRCKLRD